MFFIDPPKPDANIKEWTDWLRKDEAKARAYRAKETRKQEQSPIPEHLVATSLRKVNGKWTQCYAIGFIGSAEDGTLSGEIIDHTQDIESNMAVKQMERQRNKRGGSRAGKSKRRRANRRHKVKKTG